MEMFPSHRKSRILPVADAPSAEIDFRAAVERRPWVAFTPEIRRRAPNIGMGTSARSTCRRPCETCTSLVAEFYAVSPVSDGFSDTSTTFRTGRSPIESFGDRSGSSTGNSLSSAGFAVPFKTPYREKTRIRPYVCTGSRGSHSPAEHAGAGCTTAGGRALRRCRGG